MGGEQRIVDTYLPLRLGTKEIVSMIFDEESMKGFVHSLSSLSASVHFLELLMLRIFCLGY